MLIEFEEKQSNDFKVFVEVIEIKFCHYGKVQFKGGVLSFNLFSAFFVVFCYKILLMLDVVVVFFWENVVSLAFLCRHVFDEIMCKCMCVCNLYNLSAQVFLIHLLKKRCWTICAIILDFFMRKMLHAFLHLDG